MDGRWGQIRATVCFPTLIHPHQHINLLYPKIWIYIHRYIHRYINTYTDTYIDTYIYIYIHRYIHRNIHTYMGDPKIASQSNNKHTAAWQHVSKP